MPSTFDIIQYAFAAGEVSPKLFGRSDYEKYDFGLAQAQNWFLDYRGGLFTRAGTINGDFVQHPDKNTKMLKFAFSPDTENTYNILFGHGYIRFIQNGAYLLETSIPITSVAAGILTKVAHGLLSGDWIKVTTVDSIDQLTMEVVKLSADTFSLVFPWGVAPSNALVANITAVARIYTIANPYDEQDFFSLKYHQIRDTLRITHVDYPPKNLTRSAATSWAIADVVFEGMLDRPTGLTSSPSAAGTAGAVFIVTAVDPDGRESLPSAPLIVTNTVDYSYTTGSLKLSWNPVAGAAYYYIYRSNVVAKGSDLDAGATVGYLGKSLGTSFVDKNIVPDFVTAPPTHYNPFAVGAIRYISVTAGGAGYTNASTVTVTDPDGSGFIGFPVVVGGAIVAVVVLHGGEGYTGPTITFSVGAGATAEAELSDATGTYPRTSTIFQQRQLYGASYSQPLTIWGSRPGFFDAFDASSIIVDSDSYEFDIDTATVAPIYHLMNMRGGLLALTQAGIWLLSGGNDLAVTPTKAFAEPQTFFGPSVVSPFNIDTDILYVSEKESTVRLLAYNDYSKLYGGQDMSILSNHLFSSRNPIISWSYAETPYRLVWSVRQDGSFLAFTVVREQNIFAWCPCSTNGYVKDVLTLQEDNTDIAYMTVERKCAGYTVKFFEYMSDRDYSNVEDAVSVDNAYVHPATYPATTLTLSAATGSGVTATAGAATFSAGSVGDIIRAGGGKARITAYTSTTVVTVTVLADVTERYPESDELPLFASGDWTLDTPVSVVTSLWHLEGKTVRILADGNVMDEAVVADGQVTLSVAATRISIGLGYDCIAKTLPIVSTQGIIEGRRKDIIGVAVRQYLSRGLKIGSSLTKLVEVRDRSTELYGEPITLRSDNRYFVHSASWNRDGQTFLVQDNPLPAAVLGLVTDAEIGDDKD